MSVYVPEQCSSCGGFGGRGHKCPTLKHPEPKDVEMMRLAKFLAAQPPLPNDEESIEQWAKNLASELVKFND